MYTYKLKRSIDESTLELCLSYTTSHPLPPPPSPNGIMKSLNKDRVGEAFRLLAEIELDSTDFRWIRLEDLTVLFHFIAYGKHLNCLPTITRRCNVK